MLVVCGFETAKLLGTADNVVPLTAGVLHAESRPSVVVTFTSKQYCVLGERLLTVQDVVGAVLEQPEYHEPVHPV